jgi:hypothetical protein
MRYVNKNRRNRNEDRGFVRTNSMSLIAKEHGYWGMDIYLIDENGNSHYLMRHRYNMPLFYHLRKEISISKLRKYKYSRSNYTQRLMHCLSHILKVADSYVKYEMIDAA